MRRVLTKVVGVGKNVLAVWRAPDEDPRPRARALGVV
jgi:hypothetical protein